MLTVHKLTPDRIAPCALELREADRAELDAAGIEDTVTMLMDALPECSWANVAEWDGRPVFMYGVRPLQGGEIGVPWMLSTTHLETAQREAVAWLARRVVRRMRREFDVLTNMVHAENHDAIRFIEALGFTVYENLTGPGYRFRQFIWRRACATP